MVDETAPLSTSNEVMTPASTYSPEIRSLAYAMESMSLTERCAALIELCDQQHAIGIKNGRMGYVHSSTREAELREARIDELKRLKDEYHDNIVSDDRMDLEIDERIAELERADQYISKSKGGQDNE